MSTYVIQDSATMLRRNFRHMRALSTVSLVVVGVPVILLLLFVYVFGGTLGAGLGAAAAGSTAYVDYVMPGILLIAIAGSAQGTAISVAMDMQEGIITRFRTMGIARASVLTAHVLGSTIQTIAGLAVVVAVGILIGFRPDANPIEWVATFGVLVLITLAITWFSVALGLYPDSVEAASNLPMPLILLPFLSSGFVPVESMPAGHALVRRVPAVHAVHRDGARAADGHRDRHERHPHRRVVRGDRRLRVLVVDAALRARPEARLNRRLVHFTTR